MKYFYFIISILFTLYIAINIKNFGIGETLSLLTFCSTLLVSWLLFKKNLTGMLLAGMVLGVTVEWITEAYWDYHLNIYIWRDISLFVIMGWGYSFTFFVLISNTIFKTITGEKDIKSFDKRILIFDVIVGMIWFISNELIAMRILHLWEYSQSSNWNHIIPGLNYPIEGVIGAALISMVFPTFIRHWEKQFQMKIN